MSQVAQGTVKDYDAQTRTGTIVSDDGDEVAIEPGSLATEHLRFLRQGQRVAFDTEDADGRAVARSLRIVTFPA